ncbi:MAG: hypothetical protein U1E39_13925 [Planctomycetota bacterium]
MDAVFAAAPEARAAALDALAPFDGLGEAEIEAWRKPVLAAAAKATRSAGTKARNFLYEKPESGLYLVGGAAAGRGLLVALHGGGAGAGDAGQAASAFGGAASAAKLLLVAPEVLEKTERGWTDPPATERFVVELIEAMCVEKRLDRDRVVLTGHSMGGYGTWTIGAVHADRFCGLAAFAGAPTCLRAAEGAPIDAVEDGVLANLRNLPVFVYQSLDDRQVPAESNEFATKALAALAAADPGGYVHTYERVDGRGHDFPAAGPAPGVAWAARTPRVARPAKVVWQPSRAWKRQFYNLRWDRPELGTVVTVERGPDPASPSVLRVRVTTTGRTDGLWVLLDDALAPGRAAGGSGPPLGEVVVEVNGKEAWRGPFRRSLRTLVECALEHADPALLFTGAVPAFTAGR